MDVLSLNQSSKTTTISYPERSASSIGKSVNEVEKVSLDIHQGYEEPQKEFSKEELKKAVDGLNKWLENSNTHLSFKLHEKLNKYYVQVVSSITNEVIREVPSKKLMDVFAEMQNIIGLLVDEKV